MNRPYRLAQGNRRRSWRDDPFWQFVIGLGFGIALGASGFAAFVCWR